MLDWYWLDEDTCVFTVNGEEVEQCSDDEFDSVYNKLASKYSTRR